MDELPNLPVNPGETLDSALGIAIDTVGDGHASGHFRVGPSVRQPYGIVHGGAYAALAETLASVGTFVEVAAEGQIAMGMSNNTSFLRSVTTGEVVAEATALHKGATTWIWDVQMTDETGSLCAISRVTIAVRERRPQPEE